MKKVLATILALVMALGLCSVGWATETKETSITLDEFIKALNVDENTKSIDFDGANSEKAVNGKLTVKWSPVSGCFDDRSGHTCSVNNVKATGNTPTYINSELAQYFEFHGLVDVTICNVNFVYEAKDFTICANNNGISKAWTANEIKTAQFYMKNSGNTTIMDCSFDNVVFTSFDNTGATTVMGCTFKNMYNTYAIKDLGGSSVTVTGCSFENCSGAIMTNSNAERKEIETKEININYNQFENIDVENTAPSNKVGTRGIIQIAANTKLTAATAIQLDGNSTENCGPVLRLEQEGFNIAKITGDLSGLLNEEEKLSTTEGSKAVTMPEMVTITFVVDENEKFEAKVVKGTTYAPIPMADEETHGTFKGWKDANNSMVESVTATADMTLTAVWEKNSTPSTGGYYYHQPTTDTKADDTKGSPKTFDAGVGVYAVTAVLSVTGMAWAGKKRY